MADPADGEDRDLYDKYKNIASFKPNTMHYAAEKGDIATLAALAREGMAKGTPESVSLQARENVLGMLPLHVACENGQLECVEFLIKKRVDLDAGDHFKVTAMHLAGIENYYEIVRILLVARATVDPKDTEGDMPIHWAATKGHPDVIELLIKNKSPVDPQNNKGWTPLHRAAYNGRKAAVGVLSKLGANLEARNKDGNTALHLACFMNHLSLVELLLSLGSRMDPRNVRGSTPYDVCLTDGARELLESFGFDPKTGLQPSGPAATDAATPAASTSGPEAALPPRGGIRFSDSKRHSKKNDESDFPDLGGPLAGMSFTGAPSFTNGLLLSGPNAFLDEAVPTPPSGNPYAGLSSRALAAAGQAQAEANSEGGAASAWLRRPGSSEPTTHEANGGGIGGGGVASRVPHEANGAGTSHLASGSLRRGPGQPLPPIGGGGGASRSSATAGAAASAASSSVSLDYQDSVRERSRASAEGLAPRSRPVSGNKKFLARYNLDKLNLFGPT